MDKQVFVNACMLGDFGTVKKYIEEGGDVNVQGIMGYTGLHWSCSNGFVDITELLLQNGANTNIKNDSGFSVKENFEDEYYKPKIQILLKEYIEKNNERVIEENIPLYKKEKITIEEAIRLQYETILVEIMLNEPSTKINMMLAGVSKKDISAYIDRFNAIKNYAMFQQNPMSIIDKIVDGSKQYASNRTSSERDGDMRELAIEVSTSVTKATLGKK